LGANIIITTGTSQQVLISSTTASEAKIPIISLLPSPFITGPFTFKIIYPEDAFVLCIADFVKLHGWPKVITIYENDSLGLVSGTNLLLKDALKNVGSSLEYHVAFQPQNNMSDLDNTMETKFRQMMQYESTVYIVLHISENLALPLFKKAKELNLTSPRYVWVCGNDISDMLNSTLSPTFIAKNMQGIVGIKSYIDHSAEYQVFFSKFQKKFASDYGNINGSFFNPGVYAVRAYDAVHAISQASIESKVKNITLAEALSMVNFVGLSGTIELKNNTTIQNNKMKISNYQIFGIIGETRATLGFWYENSGFNTGMKNLSWLHELISNHNATKPSALRMLRVAIPAKPFWKNFVKVKEHSTIICSSVVDPSSVTGFCIDVFTNALKFLKYNVSYQFIAYTTEVDSSCTVRTYNDLANLVHSQV
jgi:glutamate receptor, ionotropic, plant